MKKLLLALLAIALCLAMVACDSKSKKISKDDDDDDSSVSSAVSSESSEESTESSEESTESSEESTESSEESTESSEEGKTESKNISGKYMIYSMTFGGETYTYEDLYALEATDLYIDVKSDGTFEMSDGEETRTGTYDVVAKTITLDGESVNLSVEGDFLIISDDDFNYTFTKGPLPDVEINATPDDNTVGIAGDYDVYSMYYNGEEYSYEDIVAADQYIDLILGEDGRFVLTFNDSVFEGDYTETQIVTDDGEAFAIEVDGDMVALELTEDLIYVFVKA